MSRFDPPDDRDNGDLEWSVCEDCQREFAILEEPARGELGYLCPDCAGKRTDWTDRQEARTRRGAA